MTGYTSKGGKNKVQIFTISSGAYDTEEILFDGIVSSNYTGAPGNIGFSVNLDQIRNDSDVTDFINTYAKTQSEQAEIITLEDGTEIGGTSPSMPDLGMIGYVSSNNGKIQIYAGGVRIITDTGFTTGANATTRRPIKLESVKAPSNITLGSDLIDSSIATATADITITSAQNGTEFWLNIP